MSNPTSHTIRRLTLAGLLLLAALMFCTPSALAAGGEPCPNQQLRVEDNSTGLPDCRAYELVSPPYTAGGNISGLAVVAPDGDRMIGGTVGSYAGATGANYAFNEYYYTRTPAGWVPTSLTPPDTTFPSTPQAGEENGLAAETLVQASRNLSTTLFYLRKRSATLFSYYLREPAQGSGCPSSATLVEAATEDACLVEVGPPSPTPVNGLVAEATPDVVLGTSSDLSHIVFAVRAPTSSGTDSVKYTWPGDPTTSASVSARKFSLYEYAGTGQFEPQLVGVENQHALPSEAGTKLISSCETELGTGTPVAEGDKYNAVSASGETVFFTAVSGTGCPSVNELYARVGGEKSVALSEPAHPLAQGSGSGPEECDSTCEAATHKAGVFQGASESGEKVFFLTEQPLLNGETVTTKNLYEEEIKAGKVTRLTEVSHDPIAGQAAGVAGVARVSEDGSHVYFVATGELAGNETENGEKAKDGADNLYVYERDSTHLGGRLSFIADLCSAKEESGTLADPNCPDTSTTDKAVFEEEDHRPVQATPDGEHLVFESVAHLTPGDTTSTTKQVYEYDAATGELVRVSVGQCPAAAASCSTGERYGDDGDSGTATIVSPAYQSNGFATEASSSLSLSENGAYVFFESTDALTAGALDGVESVYEYHSGEALDDGEVYLIDSGISETVEGKSFTRAATLQATTATGDDVFFRTLGDDPLVAQATNTNSDFYDARVDDGFPAPSTPAECQGEACQGMFGALFGQPAPSGSATQQAGENAPPPPPVTVSPITTGKVKITGHSVKGETITLTAKAPGKGKLTASGTGAKKATKSVKGSGSYKLKLELTAAEQKKLKAKRELSLKVKVAFKPASGEASSATATIEERKHQ